MSNILFLTHIYPFPPNDGGRIVTYNTLRILEEKQHKVFLVSFIDKDKEKQVDLKNIKQYLVNKNYSNRKLSLIKNLFEKIPFTMKKYFDGDVENKISTILKKEKIDVVILDHLHMAIYAKFIKSINHNIHVYLRQHNIESIIMKRAHEKESNLFKKTYLKMQYKKLYKFESEICEIMDQILVITEEDKETLKSMNPTLKKIQTVKAGVDLEKYKPFSYKKEDNGYKLVFLGAMNWLPNENGTIWFTENVFPELIKNIPKIKFYIVGKNPSEKVRLLEKRYPENIVVTGYVEDEREYIAMADVFIVPLLIGGGMRLKILNALAMKKAVVTTSIGAEGINLSNSYYIADSPQEFLSAIKRMLLDKSFRSNLEENGYKEVVENYSFESVLNPLLKMLES
ncbi:glycosyltransferase [Metabacillus halosaccharovorans]|uniref:glycosyltransferase n=1 Tax=Metabacillus halosaccharovorans TaxID=930124 RepID=UPI001C1F5BA4|nr:glycosyltransferase [Metabacillus halosaccharovorans]MBU7594462.1 glycosyltransferase [Metabacillus halosaccharovorans]